VSQQDVSVTLRLVPLAEALLVLAVSFMLMAGAMPVYVAAVQAAISALAVVQHVLLAEVEMLAVLDFRLQVPVARIVQEA
jgi:hypothetical protein